MRGSFNVLVLFAVALPVTVPAAQAQSCSTEKVNHEDCHIVIDRRYPVTLPTIQMSSGKRVTVYVDNPLEFETLSLDETGATALPGTDQSAAILTAAVPNFKGFVTSNVTIPAPAEFAPLAEFAFDGGNPDQAQMDVINNELAVMRSMLVAAQAAPTDDPNNTKLYQSIRIVYAQLNQALAPIPKPGSDANVPFVPPPDAPLTPNPWKDYADWRNCVLYELAGGDADGVNCQTPSAPHPEPIPPVLPSFNNVLGRISLIQGRLPSTPPAAAPVDPLFDQATFDALAKHVKADIEKLTVPANRTSETAALQKLKGIEDSVSSKMAILASTLTNVQKDFLTYYQNVYLAIHAVPPRATTQDHHALSYSTVGTIGDPQSARRINIPFLYARFLGRQVVFSVNAVNNISTTQTSVTVASARISIATVTVLYADPRLETSAGAIVSFVHNRTFANQTVTKPPAGSTLIAGDIVIAQTKTDPEVVPFVALHYRLFNDYLMPDHRRGAFYATAWVGLNPYSTVPEYGGGPTFSWRSLMLSFLYNRAHQTALISGESQGQVVCSPTATAGTTPPPCTPAPPAPITRTNAINAFAIGLSVRLPTSFTAGTGGVSR
jgi:hypothetical protein